MATTSEAALTAPSRAQVAAVPTTRAVHLGILVLSLAVFGVLSVALQQDNNWDLRNYHYYIPYAFLTGRFGFDIGPASIQTFFNPLLDVPFYLLIEHLSPRGVGLVLGAIHGLNFWLAFELAWRLWRARPGGSEPSATGVVFALVCAGLGVYGAGAASELGTTFHDLTLAPLIVGSLFLLLRAASKPPIGVSFFGAGFVLGIAVGLKQTSGVYVPGMAAMLLAGSEYAWRDRVRAFVHWGAGLAAGAIPMAGYWMHVLYTQFGNPLGPFFNSVFRSPYFPAGSGLDTQFFPKTVLQRLFYPFFFHVRALTVMEGWFQDVRWAILYVLVLATGGVLLLGRLRHRRRVPSGGLPREHRMLLVFAVVSYVVWQYLFSVYRYLIALEIVCPLLIYLCLCTLIRRDAQTRLAVCFALFVLIGAAVRLPTWGRVPWSRSFFGTEAPRLPDPAHTVVLMTGTPTAFVIPAFPREVRFVRVDGLFGAGEATRFRDTIASLVRSHSGDFYVLSQRQVIPDPDRHLLPYGLRASLQECRPVRNNADPDIVLCPAVRTVIRGVD